MNVDVVDVRVITDVYGAGRRQTIPERPARGQFRNTFELLNSSCTTTQMNQSTDQDVYAGRLLPDHLYPKLHLARARRRPVD